MAIMANGDVRFISEDIPDDKFKALCTISGQKDDDTLTRFTELVKAENLEILLHPERFQPDEEEPTSEESNKPSDGKQPPKKSPETKPGTEGTKPPVPGNRGNVPPPKGRPQGGRGAPQPSEKK